MGDIFTDANNDRCDRCGKKYNVNFPHDCPKRVLALDISTKTGWVLLMDRPGFDPGIVEQGRIDLEKRIRGFEGKKYPWDYRAGVNAMVNLITKVVTDRLRGLDMVVIEETNGSKNRYTQKILEWLHKGVLDDLHGLVEVTYVNTSDWRRSVGAVLTKDDKKLNAKVRKLKKAGNKEGLKALGVRGRTGKKHVAVRFVNDTYKLGLRMKDNDIADAICLGVSYFRGVAACDGT